MLDSSPMPAEQLEQLVGCGLAVKRCDAVGDAGGIADHFIGGDIGLLGVAGLVGDGVVAHPEDVLDPKVAQGQARGQRGRFCGFGGWRGVALAPCRLSAQGEKQ
ncbi:hypothetical protein D3C71_1608650 [compost metagenome]